MQGKIKEKIKKRFPEYPIKKIILYKNINEFSTLYIERINPEHKGIIWGRRRKKFNKGNHYIMCARVIFNALPVILGLSVLGWIDALLGYTFKLLLILGIYGLITGITLSILYYGFPYMITKRRLQFNKKGC